MDRMVEVYRPKHHIRVVTATSLFDGHDASINIMRRILQATGCEVIHLGHNRSAEEIVNAAIEEDAHGIGVSSYQGGHIEFFKYIIDLLKEKGSPQIRVLGGGGGVIIPEEIRELENSYNNLKLEEIVTKFYERDKNKLLEYRNKFIQNYDPVYIDPDKKDLFSFRTHFFAPAKYMFGTRFNTFSFNIGLVFVSTIILYITLYFNVLGRIIFFFENLRTRK